MYTKQELITELIKINPIYKAMFEVNISLPTICSQAAIYCFTYQFESDILRQAIMDLEHTGVFDFSEER